MNKVRSLQEAISLEVQDGMAVAMGFSLEPLIPFAAGYEMIRGKRNESLHSGLAFSLTAATTVLGGG